VSGQAVDSVIADIREEITAVDEQLVARVNQRIAAVARIRVRKAEVGVDFFDPDREARLLQHLQEANAGPLSEAGLAELHGFILDLVKREASSE
jgi:chorismate mutase/prephenate dehydratase